jgi:hypothetical protein
MFFLFLVLFEVTAIDSDFRNVISSVTEKTSPSELLGNLAKIRGKSKSADAFLSRYGGTNFKEETGATIKFFGSDIDAEVNNAARLVGEILYKRGASNWNNDGSLAFAQNLLNKTSSFSGESSDVGSSIFNERLGDMSADRINFDGDFFQTLVLPKVDNNSELESIRQYLLMTDV